MPADRFEAGPPREQEALYARIWAEARDGFQYLFDRHRITERRDAGLKRRRTCWPSTTS